MQFPKSKAGLISISSAKLSGRFLLNRNAIKAEAAYFTIRYQH
jgi:hypothetical protein